MRAIFSVLALLVVVYLVMQLAGTQLRSVAPAAGGAPTADSGPPAATPAGVAQQRAGQVVDALQQGAAQRASDTER